MIKAGDSVTAAVSGGADSVAMLCVLKDLSESLDFSLKAVHINHNLRGDESNRDELFVRNLCSELNIECDFYSVDVMSRALEKKISIELAARQARYEIFSEIEGNEGFLVASKLAAEYKLTRSVIVNALRKLESAGVIDARSLGMKGTYIKILNDYLYEELAAI